MSDKGAIKTVPSNIIIGRTKAMFFHTIEKLLENNYGDSMPVDLWDADYKHGFQAFGKT